MQAVVRETEMVGLRVKAGTTRVVAVPPATVMRVAPQPAPTGLVMVPVAPTPVRVVPSPELAPVRVRVGGAITIVEGGGAAVDATYIADGPISGHTWVSSLEPGHCQPSDNRDAWGGKCVGITLGAAGDGDTITVRSSGPLHEPSWSWIPQDDIVIGEGGLGTQTPPVGNPGHPVYLQVVGWATGPDDIFIDLGPDPIYLS